MQKINFQEKKNIGLRRLKEIIELLESYNLEYWIDYGTLLGAIRGGDIIPWDTEFDIGIWNHDINQVKNDFIKECIDRQYEVNINRRDRIKLIHKNDWLGAYSIDINTYHVSGDIAYVSFDLEKRKKLSKILKKVLNLFQIVGDDKCRYMMGDMIYPYVEKYNVVPQEITFREGKFCYKKSFILQSEDKVIDNDAEYFQKIGKIAKYAIMVANFFPPFAIRHTRNKIKQILDNMEISDEIQVVPLSILSELKSIKFGNINVNAPSKAEEYIRLIYGENWREDNPNWKREDQNNIIN